MAALDFEHGRHLCPKCGGWVPGAIDTDYFLIRRALNRDTSWAWCGDCKRIHREERERMLAAEPKLGCATLAVNHVTGRRVRKLVSIVCDVCGVEFEGQQGKKRCSAMCRREAAKACAARSNGRPRESRPGAPRSQNGSPDQARHTRLKDPPRGQLQ